MQLYVCSVPRWRNRTTCFKCLTHARAARARTVRHETRHTQFTAVSLQASTISPTVLPGAQLREVHWRNRTTCFMSVTNTQCTHKHSDTRVTHTLLRSVCLKTRGSCGNKAGFVPARSSSLRPYVTRTSSPTSTSFSLSTERELRAQGLVIRLLYLVRLSLSLFPLLFSVTLSTAGMEPCLTVQCLPTSTTTPRSTYRRIDRLRDCLVTVSDRC